MKKIEEMNLEELAKVRKKIDSLLMEKLYGLRGGLSDSIIATEFDKRRSHIWIKNDTPMGDYDLIIRPPEQSTLKLDLESPGESTKQIRIFFTFEEWRKITGL